MATPRKTATKAEQLRVSQISDFKQRLGGLQELPSGLVVKVRNPGGLTGFIANGSIPNNLLKVVQEALSGDNSTEDAITKAREISQDLDSIRDMMALMDIVVTQVIVEPVCLMAPTEDDLTRHNMIHSNNPLSTPDQLRDDSILYSDDIDQEDKQFLFQWISGGTRDLEKFRSQLEANVVAVSTVQGTKANPKSSNGADNG